MSNIVDLNSLFHRSKDRIKVLGEVFTPEKYVEDMLELISAERKEIWSDEEISFFEPCSGHGNIVISIFKMRLNGIYKKAYSIDKREAAFYAVANAINTIWAIDIDKKNVENCRSRVLLTTLMFLRDKLGIHDDFTLISKNKKFIAHVISAIKWHISENETLSALSNKESARINASQTKAGSKWFSQHGHHELNFNLTWVNYFEACEQSNSYPLEFKRVTLFIEGLLSKRSKGFDDLNFAKVAFDFEKEIKKNTTVVSVGA